MNNKGIIETLFDFSFSEFVTTRFIKILFIIGIAFAGLGALSLIVGGFSSSFGRGLLMLVVSPVIFLIYVLLARIWCEIIIVVFRIAENTARMANQAKTAPAPEPASTPPAS